MAINAVINFANQIGPLIVAEGKKRGYKISSTIIAQAIIESKYGESKLASLYHNYFGIKSGKAWLNAGKPSINMKTREEYKVGQLTTITDYFRVYPDMKSGVEGYFDFISTSRYANLKNATTYRRYAEFLKQDGYATSSSYVNTLCTTVEKYGLTAYDGVPIQEPSIWEIGKTYTTQQDLYIRITPGGNHTDWLALTPNAQGQAFKDDDGYPILRRNTRVTVKEIKKLADNTTWLKIPSGWICGKNSKNIYVL